MLLSPETATKLGIADVVIKDDRFQARYVASDDDFIGIARRCHMHWDKELGWWRRTPDARALPVSDRCAELVARLLKAGFTVSVTADEETIRKATGGNWEPEHRRWILRAYTGKLLIQYDKYDGNSEIRIAVDHSGARWSTIDGGFLLDAGLHERLGDLIRLYDFRVDADAQKEIDAYERKRAEAVTVRPKVREKVYNEPGVAGILKSSDEILPDLKDE